MKLIFILCLSLLLSLAAAAQGALGPAAVANFSVDNGQPFGLVLDGRPVGRPAPQLRLDDVGPGRHTVELALGGERGRGGAVRVPATVWLEEGLETTFVLTRRPGYGWALRQVSTAALPGYGFEGQGNTYASGDYGGGGYGPAPGGFPGGTGSFPGGPGGFPGGAGPGAGGPYLRQLAPGEVADLQQAIQQRPFDDDRLAIARQALSQSALRAEELAGLVRAVSFEQNRVKLATFGYGHVVDPQNFYKVYSAFQFSSSVREVQRALGF